MLGSRLLKKLPMRIIMRKTLLMLKTLPKMTSRWQISVTAYHLQRLSTKHVLKLGLAACSIGTVVFTILFRRMNGMLCQTRREVSSHSRFIRKFFQMICLRLLMHNPTSWLIYLSVHKMTMWRLQMCTRRAMKMQGMMCR